MGKNVIVSEETVRDLLEAHASLSAWYYELWAALRSGTAPRPPDDVARRAFVERLAVDFPELGSVARSIRVPRLFVPPPPSYNTPRLQTEPAAAAVQTPTLTTEAASTDATLKENTGTATSAPVVSAPDAPAIKPAIAPPAMVNPAKVKYDP